MTMEQREEVPIWRGDPSRFDDFAEEVKIYVHNLDEKHVATAGTRIARADPQDSQQRKLAMSLGI